MTGSILDADVATLFQGLGGALAWWREQLAALVPARLRREAVGRATIVAWPAPGGDLRLMRGDREIAPEQARGAVAIVAVPEAACLIRTLAMPALSEADVRRAVALDLDRLMPFPPGTALVELDVGAPADGGRPVTLAALPLAQAQAALEASARAGLEPSAIALLDGDGAIRFDFLPALRAARGERDVHAERRFWWRTVLFAFVLNLIVLVAADLHALHGLEALVEAHGEVADRVRIDRRRLIDEQGWRQAFAARRAARDPLALLADITALLPATARLKRLELEGGHVRLVGVRREGADVLGILRRDPRFRNVRASTVDVLAATPEGQPFDIGFDRAG